MSAIKKSPKDTVVLCLVDENGKLKGVAGAQPDGQPKTAEPTAKNQADFLTVDKNSNALENFFKNFLAQAKNPKHTGFYAFSVNTIERAGRFLENLIKEKPDDKALAPYRIEPQAFLDAKQGKEVVQEPTGRFQPLDLNKVDWQKVDNLGVPPAALDSAFKSMLWGHKSPDLVDIKPTLNGQECPAQARVSLEVKPDGCIEPVIHPKQEKPDFDKPFMGVTFSKEDIDSFKHTGHGGRVFDLEKTPGGEKIPSLVSLDPKTNRFEAVAVADIHVGETLKGAKLSAEQQDGLRSGKAVWVEGMEQRVKNPGDEPKTMNRFVQFNAANKNFDFKFSPEQKQAHEEKKTAKQENPQQEQRQSKGQKVGCVFVPHVWLGVKLSDEQFKSLTEGKATYIKDMERPQKQGEQKVEATDAKGQKFNAYVKPSQEEGKLKFYKWNPDQSQKQGAQVKPAAESKTQHAVNNEGKTNEATKHSPEPLKKGQQQPTEKQAEKKEQKQQQEQRPSPAKPKKGKGLKM